MPGVDLVYKVYYKHVRNLRELSFGMLCHTVWQKFADMPEKHFAPFLGLKSNTSMQQTEKANSLMLMVKAECSSETFSNFCQTI
jgi:hypothetical protein